MFVSNDQLEKNEIRSLKPYAVLSQNSRGRKYPEPEDPQRLPFQKDRDRIIHSRGFRRLREKTQVFVAHYGDHYRNRLTHSLEVAQISRDLARSFGLNEDLAEAISLAHDLGHTPFGHAGEFALHECLQKYGLEFEHNAQSRRQVEELEHVYPDHPGLNLTVETLEGLMKHQTSWDNPRGAEAVRPSLEAQIVNFGDEIAYQNHDVDDGLRSGLFSEEDLEKLALWKQAREECELRYGKIDDPRVRFARVVSKMIGLMVQDIIVETSERLEQFKIQSLEDVYACPEKIVTFSPVMEKVNRELKEFLLTRLYLHPDVQGPMEKGQRILTALFEHFMKNPKDLPTALAERWGSLEQQGPGRAALLRDYLAGMTDRFASLEVERLGLV